MMKINTEDSLSFDGQVLSGIILREMTLNGEYVSVDEIIESDWVGVLATLGHPKSPSGKFISALEPLAAKFVVGKIIESSLMANGELFVIVVLDKKLPGISKGDIVECSTGFFRNITQKSDGRPASVNLKPDHIAILLNEVGACSKKDGCGLMVNCKCNEGFRMKEENEEKSTAIDGESNDKNDLSFNNEVESRLDKLESLLKTLAARTEALESANKLKEKGEKERYISQIKGNQADIDTSDLMKLSVNSLRSLASLTPPDPSLHTNYSRGGSSLPSEPEKLIEFEI